LEVFLHGGFQPAYDHFQLFKLNFLFLYGSFHVRYFLLFDFDVLQLLLVFGFYRLCLKDQIIASLSFGFDLGMIFVVFHADYLLLGGQSLLCLDFKFHVVVKEVFILAVVTYTFELLIQATSFSEMFVTGFHIAKTAKDK
jgi:hypothetical protein